MEKRPRHGECVCGPSIVAMRSTYSSIVAMRSTYSDIVAVRSTYLVIKRGFEWGIAIECIPCNKLFTKFTVT
jgi:hypothetical protein